MFDGSGRPRSLRGCRAAGIRDRFGERATDDRQLDRHVHQQGPGRHPREGVVRRDEREGPRVPLGGVGQPGDQLEDRGPHEQCDRHPLEQVQQQRASGAVVAG